MISPREAMAILGITSRSAFWKVVYDQKIPHMRVPGSRLIRFERQEIERRKQLWTVKSAEDLRYAVNGRRLS